MTNNEAELTKLTENNGDPIFENHHEIKRRQLARTISEYSKEGRRNGGNDNVWFCCKEGRTDPRLLQFLITTLFSLIILIFSIIQLLRLESCEAQNTYIGLVTLVFGIFLPSPKVKI